MEHDDETPVIALIDGKEPYKAYSKEHVSRKKPLGDFHMLDIVDRERSVETVMYSYILRQHYIFPRQISLICADAAVLIAGRELDTVRELIRDRRVSELQVYNPTYHREPPEGVPVIEAVMVEPRQPYEVV